MAEGVEIRAYEVVYQVLEDIEHALLGRLGDAPARLTIGRSAQNAVALPWDREVSRVHVTLEHIGNEWALVEDGRSRNGSYIDGERVHGRMRLSDGDAEPETVRKFFSRERTV